MKKLLGTLVGLSVAGALVVVPGTGLAHKGEPENVSRAIAKAMKHPLVVRGGTSAKVTIVHVIRGCHVWSNGVKQAAGAKVFLDRGGKLTLMNHDVDLHKLVRLAGPKAALGGYVMMGHQKTVTFTRAGTYKLRTPHGGDGGQGRREDQGARQPASDLRHRQRSHSSTSQAVARRRRPGGGRPRTQVTTRRSGDRRGSRRAGGPTS